MKMKRDATNVGRKMSTNVFHVKGLIPTAFRQKEVRSANEQLFSKEAVS